MTTPFLWDAGAYTGARANYLTTELNALAVSAANVLSTLGAAFNQTNTIAHIYADAEFLAGVTFTPLASGFLELWLLRSLDASAFNYEDGSATIAPGRPADLIIPVRAGTTITPRSGRAGLIMPPGNFKPILRNQSGATLPATGNILSLAFYREAS